MSGGVPKCPGQFTPPMIDETKNMFSTYLISGYKNGEFTSEIFTGNTVGEVEMKAYNSGFSTITKIKEI